MFKQNEDKSNFWISYADLMAGLLFVFILLLGAIVTKSILLQQDLTKKKEALLQTKKHLKLKEQGMMQLAKTVNEQSKKIKLQEDEIKELKHLLWQRMKELHKKEYDLNKTKEVLVITQKELELKKDEIKRLNELLLARNSKIDFLNKKIVILQNVLNETNTTLLQKEELLKKMQNKVLVLSKELSKKEDELHLSSQKLLALTQALDEKRSSYENLIKKLQAKKARIKRLTGIRLKAVEELKKSFGKSIKLANDGSIMLNSKILFDKDSAKLKDEAKKELRELFTKYIKILMSNQALAPYIDKIIIEGHTDSDGGYLYNLKLSQERALNVMRYLLTLPVAKKYDLQKLLVASGRSFVDKIIKNGKEDKEASRRIEFKFRLKNQDAMMEIERILDENSTL